VFFARTLLLKQFVIKFLLNDFFEWTHNNYLVTVLKLILDLLKKGIP